MRDSLLFVRTGAHLFVLAGLIGCSESDRLHTTLPEVAGAKSVVLAVGDSQRLRLFAGALPIADPLLLPFEVSDSDRAMEAAFFEGSLMQLGITSGVIEPASDRDVLPAAAKVFETKLDGAWSERASISPAFAAQKLVPRRSSCSVFTARTLDSGATHGIDLAAAIDRDTVLTGNIYGQLQLIREDGVTALPEIRDVAPHSAYVAPDGRIFLGGAEGSLWRLTIDPFAVERLATATVTGALRHLTGGYDQNGEIELFAVAFDGQFLRWSQDEWQPLHQFFYMENVFISGGAVHLGPGHAVAARRSSRDIARWRNGTLTLSVPPELNGAVQALGFVEALGAVASDELGVMVHDAGGGEWRPLGNSRLSLELNAISQFRDGFVAGGVFGFIVEYRPGEGFCEQQQLGSYNINVIAPLGESLVLAGEKPNLQDTVTITIITRAP